MCELCKNSCWVVKFTNGNIVLMSEDAYNNYHFEPGLSEVHEHWFIAYKAMQNYRDAKVVW